MTASIEYSKGVHSVVGSGLPTVNSYYLDMVVEGLIAVIRIFNTPERDMLPKSSKILVNVKKGTRDWIRLLPDATQLCSPKWPGFHFIWDSIPERLIAFNSSGGRVRDLDFSVYSILSDNWEIYTPKKVPVPVPGSCEDVLASPVGACWWMGADRTLFRRRTAAGIAGVRTIDGDARDWELSGNRGLIEGGYSRVVDRNGKPAEPKPGTQLWADIVRLFPGVKVRHRNMSPGNYICGDDFYAYNGQVQKAAYHWFNENDYLTDWEIYTPEEKVSKPEQPKQEGPKKAPETVATPSVVAALSENPIDATELFMRLLERRSVSQSSLSKKAPKKAPDFLAPAHARALMIALCSLPGGGVTPPAPRKTRVDPYKAAERELLEWFVRLCETPKPPPQL